MVSKEKLDRINELAKKKKTVGLTEQEQQERDALHQEYVAAVRNALRSQLESIEIVYEEDPDEWTDEEKENLIFLTEKLGKELREQKQQENAADDALRVKIEGNPSNPTGEQGKKLLDQMNVENKELTDWGLDYVKDLDPATVLDVGCGGGAALANLRSRFPQAVIYGVDSSEVAVEKSLAYNRDAVVEDKVRISHADVQELPFGDNFFDLVISVESHFYWDKFKKAIKEVYRVLKPGGTLLIVSSMTKGIELSPEEEMMSNTFIHNLLSLDELKVYLKEADYDHIDIETKPGTHWVSVKARKKD